MSNLNIPTLPRPKTASSSSSFLQNASCCNHKNLLESAEEKIRALANIADSLRLQLDQKARAHERDIRFTRNLLQTLNARGFTQLVDHNDVIIDLNLCKGDCTYELKGRDNNNHQNNNNVQHHYINKTKVKKVWGNECYFKAIIGNQERNLQNIQKQFDLYKNNVKEEEEQVKSSQPGGGEGGCEKSVETLETELQQLIGLLEGTCQRYPDIFYALREQHQLDKEKRNKSQRTIGSGSVSRTTSGGEMGIVEKVLVSLSCKSKVIPCQDLMNPEVKEAPQKTEASMEERHSIELLDFEKFIGAAVLQLRGAGLGFTATPTKDSKKEASSDQNASPSSVKEKTHLPSKVSTTTRNKGKSTKKPGESLNRLRPCSPSAEGPPASTSLPPIMMPRPHTTSNAISRSHSSSPGPISRPFSSSAPRNIKPPRPRSLQPYRPQLQVSTVSLPFLGSGAGGVDSIVSKGGIKRNRMTYHEQHLTRQHSKNVLMSCPYCKEEFGRSMSPEEVRKHLERHVF